MSCPNCRAGHVVEIDLTVGLRPVTMRSCSRCDTRWWQGGDDPIPLAGVLALASRR